MDSYAIKNYINAGYEIENDKTMLMLYEIVNAKTIEEIDAIINKYNVTPEPLQFNERLIKFQSENMKQNIFSPTSKTNFEYQDGVKIIDDSTCDLTKFKMITHVIKNRRNDGSINGDLSIDLLNNPSLWVDNSVKGSDVLSCSLVSQNDLKLWGKDNSIVLGFSDLDNPYIYTISSGDSGTPMEGLGVDYSKKNKFAKKELVADLTNNVNSKFNITQHNEVAFGRKINGEKIKPSYLLSIKNFSGEPDRNVPINDSTIKWAKFYNIPIVVVDGEKIKERATNELEELMLNLKSGNISSALFYEIILRYRTIENVMGKPMNLEDIINAFLDISINNPSLNNIQEIENIINNYPILDMLKNDSDNYKENLENIMELRKQKINLKIEQINKIVLTQQTQEEVIIGKGMGFVSLNYLTYGIVISLVVLLIIILLNTI